jgi:hypothetical protein
VALFAAGIAARTRGKVLWRLTHQDLFVPSLSQVGLSAARVICRCCRNAGTLHMKAEVRSQETQGISALREAMLKPDKEEGSR